MESLSFSYDDSEWHDLLTSYDGSPITYDEIGNPLSYRGSTFVWNGRQLTQATKGSETMSYVYGVNGMRLQKTYTTPTKTVTTAHTTDGAVIYADFEQTVENGETTNEYRAYFYDESGSPVGFMFHGQNYYFEKTLQGDISRIYDSQGNAVGEYLYDAWGNLLNADSLTDIAKQNPFRYRGYYFDSETGMYYLRSRYYDPQVGRFINADSASTLSATPTGLTDKNLFAYCDNNPVIRIDCGGKIWETVFDLLSLGVSVVEVCMNPADPWAWIGLVGDAVDLIPFVTGVGEIARAVKTTVTVVDNATDVVDAAKTIYKTADAASDIRKATGSYEILYKSGKNYIGKGGFNRAIKSATRNATKYGDEVTSIMWKSSPSSKLAFIDEYLMQKEFGGVLSSNKKLPTYNKIWSPGRRYFGD